MARAPDPNFAARVRDRLPAPASGERLIARGAVVKSGRSLTITRAEVYAEQAGERTLCAVMQQTLITLHERSDA